MPTNFLHIKNQLNAQEKYLTQLTNYLDAEIRNLPKGRVRMQKRAGNIDYYWCNAGETKSSHGIYISRKNQELISSLARKNYYEKSHKAALSMLHTVQQCNSNYNEQDLTDIYYTLSPERQKLVDPLFLSDEDYAAQWRDVQYERKEDFSEDWSLFSMRGERMRSKSEIMIASLFDKYDIPYRYEYPVQINGKTFRPDFIVLNKRTRKEYIWEHFGMLGIPDYANNCVSKIGLYAKNGYFQGINAIYTFESDGYSTPMEIYEIYIREFLI